MKCMTRAQKILSSSFQLVDDLETARQTIRVEINRGLKRAQLIQRAAKLLRQMHEEAWINEDEWDKKCDQWLKDAQVVEK